MKVAFFNQPWLVSKYPAGTRLVLHGSRDARNRFRVTSHATTSEGVGAAGAVAHYPATEGLSLDADPRARARASAARARRRRAAARAACARATGCPTGPRRCSPRTPATSRAAAAGSRSRSCCSSSSTCCAGACTAATRVEAIGARRARATGSSRRWLGGDPAVRADRRPANARSTRSSPTSREPRPMQRLLMGEVGSGKTVVALAAMLRAVEHGHQAAMMAPTEVLAEQHFATLQALMPGEAVPAALLTGSTPAARRADIARQARQRRAAADRRHARADRARRALRVARRRGRRRAAPLRRAPARRARRQGAGRASRRTCCT